MENKKECCSLCGKEINQDNWGVNMGEKVFCAGSCATKIFTNYLKNLQKPLDKSNEM